MHQTLLVKGVTTRDYLLPRYEAIILYVVSEAKVLIVNYARFISLAITVEYRLISTELSI